MQKTENNNSDIENNNSDKENNNMLEGIPMNFMEKSFKR